MNTNLINTKLHECVLVRDAQAVRDLFVTLKTLSIADDLNPMAECSVLGLPVKTLAAVPENEVWIISKGKNPGQVAQEVDVIRAMLEE